MLALGDSYTIGESVAADERWPSQLAKQMLALEIELDVRIVAETGWTTDELSQAIGQASLDHKYDLVSLMIGVNNQFRGYSIGEFETEFQTLLGQAIAVAEDRPAHVLVLSIPDWGQTAFGAAYDREQVSKDIDAYNAAIRQLCAEAGSNYIDVTAISRLAIEKPQLVADDGLHPSGAMYGLWVEEMLPEVLKVIND